MVLPVPALPTAMPLWRNRSPTHHHRLNTKRKAKHREKIALEVAKHSHPLTVQSKVLYNIVNGQVAPTVVYVDKSVIMGQAMASSFQTNMTTAFHNKISNPVKTMEHLKRGIKVGAKTIFDLKAIFIRLLMVGQQRQLQLTTIFQYELCAVPPSIIDEYGCLRKGYKSALANQLGVEQCYSTWVDSPP
ncbi:hypothetical protein Pcinc_018026 [Petrolisthes cinctipes]|uniref:Uncharacterized protein n=1 Tax=Petrolisthes cinctipes TaxID=88211 RepID=A0AAE1FP34_PETCI|nr:hypothetical protein Pcinc_018026 [Petrolisthes cinctipes]